MGSHRRARGGGRCGGHPPDVRSVDGAGPGYGCARRRRHLSRRLRQAVAANPGVRYAARATDHSTVPCLTDPQTRERMCVLAAATKPQLPSRAAGPASGVLPGRPVAPSDRRTSSVPRPAANDAGRHHRARRRRGSAGSGSLQRPAPGSAARSKRRSCRANRRSQLVRRTCSNRWRTTPTHGFDPSPRPTCRQRNPDRHTRFEATSAGVRLAPPALQASLCTGSVDAGCGRQRTASAVVHTARRDLHHPAARAAVMHSRPQLHPQTCRFAVGKSPADAAGGLYGEWSWVRSCWGSGGVWLLVVRV